MASNRRRVKRAREVAVALSQRTERPMWYGGPDPITMNKLETLITNVTSVQRERYSRSAQADPRRDLDDECGYPKTDWSSDEYHDLIISEPVACIANMLYPIEAWQLSPSLYEDEDSESVTEFEAAWDALPEMLSAEPTHYAEEENSAMWNFLLSADILAGEGRYGAILIGLDDGKDLSEPASPRANQEVTFLRAFPEHLARVSTFQQDKSKPRYGWPESYQVTFSDYRDQSNREINEPTTSEYVHWSRIVHIVDNWHVACSSPMFVIPRCKPIRNQILDIRKVRGSSAEMYYLGAFGGHHFGTHPTLGADVDVNADDMRDMYEEYRNGLQRAIFTSGMSVDPLASQVVDPTPQILAQIESIAMVMRCPKRKLIGNETGERATLDDSKSWSGRIQSRNKRFTTPRLVIPLVDRLINLKVLPKPGKGYRLWWPDIYSMSDDEKAKVLLTKTQAYGTYIEKGIEQVIPPMDYMTKFDDMEEEVAESILEAAEERQEELWEENQEMADEQGMVPEVDGFKQPEPDPIELEKAKAKAKASVTRNEEAIENCGGPGSGVPGPCARPKSTPAKVAPTKVALQETVKKEVKASSSVGAAEHLAADAVAHRVAKAVKGITEEQAGGPGQKDKKPFDVRTPKEGGKGFHDIEVKSLLKRAGNSISVHDDALLRKVEHQKKNPDNTFHTVVSDERATYGGGAFKGSYSGHQLYYKRGSGRFSLNQMHKVKDEAELQSLINTPTNKLPAAARGKLPPPPPLADLKAKAAKASEERKARDKIRKERNKEVLQAQAKARRERGGK